LELEEMLVDVDHVDQELLQFLEILHQQAVVEVELMVLMVFQEDQEVEQVDVVLLQKLLEQVIHHQLVHLKEIQEEQLQHQ
jgi:hypothetical protein